MNLATTNPQTRARPPPPQIVTTPSHHVMRPVICPVLYILKALPIPATHVSVIKFSTMTDIIVVSLVFLLCSEINFVSKLSCGIQSALDGGNHLALHRKRLARNARARRRRMAATAKLRGDFVHVHLVIFGTEADTGQFGLSSSNTQATTTGSMARMWSINPSVSSLSAPVRAKSPFFNQNQAIRSSCVSRNLL